MPNLGRQPDALRERFNVGGSEDCKIAGVPKPPLSPIDRGMARHSQPVPNCDGSLPPQTVEGISARCS